MQPASSSFLNDERRSGLGVLLMCHSNQRPKITKPRPPLRRRKSRERPTRQRLLKSLYGGERTPARPILTSAIGRGGEQNPSVLPETVVCEHLLRSRQRSLNSSQKWSHSATRREGVVALLVVRCHGHSVFHAHADHDENRIILLRAALDRRHRSPWCNRKRSLLRVCRRARTINRRRCIARGAAGQVCHVVERRAVIE